jgi:hypothetical protein
MTGETMLKRVLMLITGAALSYLAYGQPVTKCTVNGKTIYTDAVCPSNAKSKDVEMSHAAGVVSPDRATVDDTMNRMRDENWANAVPGRSITRTTTRNGHTTTNTINNPLSQSRPAGAATTRFDCRASSDRVSQLDSMARQPQSGRTQDWIKDEKQKERSLQYRASC